MSYYNRFRIIETTVRDKQNFVIQWNDRWFFGLWGFWHDKFICENLDECTQVINRLVLQKDK
tara:strand:+ start:107 stop:292 length:186 start_codon:yes stop_codon:yes gene_type:complete